MPGFELERVDGGDPVDLPYGETVIGRGAFLGVSDKRVSRNHAILENLDGQLRIKSIHLNPCFIQASLQSDLKALEKDQWHCLKEGSIFSLLPEKYVYRVKALSEEGTPRNSQGREVEAEAEENSKPSQLCEHTLAYTPRAVRSSASLTLTSSLPTHAEKTEAETHAASPASCSQAVASGSSTADGPNPATPHRRRVLPAWMTAATPAVLSSSPAEAAKPSPARPVQKPTQPRRTAEPKTKRARPFSGKGEELEVEEEEEEEENEEHSEVLQKPRRRVKRLKSDTEESQDQTRSPKPETGTSAEGGGQLDVSRKEEGQKRGRRRADDATSSEAGNSGKNVAPSQNGQSRSGGVTEAEVSSSASVPKVPRRTSCPYGTSCYRKNPLHFQECSHPGDADYGEDHRSGADEDDDRPECPYGTDCYRKNLLHKKEYKHTKPPAKRSRPDDDDDDDDEEEDEDRYEDSFINDESEVDEDSEYVPESDGSDEDVKRLQKEAKAFLRKRK